MNNINYRERIFKSNKLLDVLKINALIVTDSFNMNYLTGFSGGEGEGIVLLINGKAFLVTDERYTEELKNNNESIKIISTRNYILEIINIIKNNSKNNIIGFEDSIRFNLFDQLENEVSNEIVETKKIIDMIRTVKSDYEIQQIKKANELSQKAFEESLKDVKPGITEKQFADILDFNSKNLGLSKSSFDTIVASGKNSSYPHAKTTNKEFMSGDVVTVDFGYYYNDYTSDITRTFFIDEPSDEIKKVYELIIESLNKSYKILKEGISSKDIDDEIRNFLKENKVDKYFIHASGHGVGLDVHELPILSSISNEEIFANNILTIEPGLYFKNFGIRVENDYLVNKNSSENLNKNLSTDMKIIYF